MIIGVSNRQERPAQSRAPRFTGAVVSFNLATGYGFVSLNATDAARAGVPPGHDLFLHASQITPRKSALARGDQVEFEVGNNYKGPCAVNATVTLHQDIYPHHD